MPNDLGRPPGSFVFGENTMKSCPKMKHVIETLAKLHEIDLTQKGAHFRLDMPGYDRLCVENIGLNRVAVTHYFEQNGDLVQDPEVVFFVGDENLGWVPIGVTQVIGGWRTYARVAPDGSKIVAYRKAAQASLADFAEMWAQNIEDQGWLEDGIKHSSGTDEGTVAEEKPSSSNSRWPEPTVEQPDFETLEQWMWEDGCCEATDGCMIEPDGVCQHGHPSWLLRLGFI